MPTKQKRPKGRKVALRDEDGQILRPGTRTVFGRCVYCGRNALIRKRQTPVEVDGKIVYGALVCLRDSVRASRNGSLANQARKLSKADVTLGMGLDQAGRSIREICEAINRQRQSRGATPANRMTICRRCVPSSLLFRPSTQEP